MVWTPNPYFHYVLKRGMAGADVFGLQLNLDGVTADGYFGALTAAAVAGFQSGRGLTVDGIAGIATQKMICQVRSGAAKSRYSIPNGLLSSIMENESGYAIGAYSAHPSDSGFDLGPYQNSIPPDTGTQAIYAFSYKVSEIAADTASKLRNRHDAYISLPKVASESWYGVVLVPSGKTYLPDRYAWQLAVLFHNWEYAADNLASIGSIFKDPSQDTQPAVWVQQASGGSMSTPREWVIAYILRSTAYTSW